MNDPLLNVLLCMNTRASGGMAADSTTYISTSTSPLSTVFETAALARFTPQQMESSKGRHLTSSFSLSLLRLL